MTCPTILFEASKARPHPRRTSRRGDAILLLCLLALITLSACKGEIAPPPPPGTAHPIEGAWFGTVMGPASVEEIFLEIDSAGRIWRVERDGVETDESATTEEVMDGLFEAEFADGLKAVIALGRDGEHIAMMTDGPSFLESDRAVLQRGEPYDFERFEHRDIAGHDWSGERLVLNGGFRVSSVVTSNVTVFASGAYRGVSGDLAFLNNRTIFGDELRLIDDERGLVQGGYSENLEESGGLMLVMLTPDGEFAMGNSISRGADHPVGTRLHFWNRE